MQQLAKARGILAALLVTCGLAIVAFPRPVYPKDEPKRPELQNDADRRKPLRRALLIGCTTYDNNPEKNLKGPLNDVTLMRQLLVDKFGFNDEAIRILSEGRSRDQRPIRKAIVREFERLIEQTAKDDTVFVYLAGHGSQQPDQAKPDPRADEPDGMDEVFLPADCGKWNNGSPRFENAVIDDELHDWLGKLIERGARVLVILDACHSGSGIRGDISDEVPRRIEPKPALPEIPRGGNPPEAENDPLDRGDWVALYAAQSNQTTSEAPLRTLQEIDRNMLAPGSENNHYGVFTFALCQALQRDDVPSYQQLIQTVRGLYATRGRLEPSPFVEGTHLNNRFLGAEQLPTVYRLSSQGNHWVVSGGILQGLTNGSVLAVSPPGKDVLAGHVKVVASGVSTSQVEPCAHGDAKQKHLKPTQLPVGGVCRVVFLDYGESRLPIAIDPDVESAGATPEQFKDLNAQLGQFAKEQNSSIRLERDPRQANWILSFDPRDASNPWILRSRAIEQFDRAHAPDSGFRLTTSDTNELQKELLAVARVVNLRSIATRSNKLKAAAATNLDVSLVVNRVLPGDQLQDISLERLPELQDGDKLQFVIKNNDPRRSIDFTLLFIDSHYGIEPIFPLGFADFNRLQPGQSISRPADVTSNTVGVEQILLIAVPAQQPEPISFAYLAQPQLKTAAVRGGQENVLPLDRLLESAAQFQGATRGLSSGKPIDQFRMQIAEWKVVSGNAAK